MSFNTGKMPSVQSKKARDCGWRGKQIRKFSCLDRDASETKLMSDAFKFIFKGEGELIRQGEAVFQDPSISVATLCSFCLFCCSKMLSIQSG